ncbi:MAG: hypothetical protein ACD_49C00049G0013 [uncultured bacterium (gcode 4)]|uniref:Uncharacterized protein n=1 Tax=uncultured bacterium (gcode 4) TaxID=1234023 RepID=K2AEA0_9BACT|nr:MAG: hypothetical protein ACD_49C00049G0013 [uncultured bacterium (gcode 4)]
MKKLILLILSIILVSPLLVQAESSSNSWKWLIYTDFVDGTKFKKDIDSNSDPIKISDSEFEKLLWSENKAIYSQDKKIKVTVDDQNIYINDKVFIKNDRNYKLNMITSDNKYLIYSYYVDQYNSVFVKNLNESIDKKWVYTEEIVIPSCINLKDNVFYYEIGGSEMGKVYKKKYSDILNDKVSWEDILWFQVERPAVFSSDCKTIFYSDMNWVVYKKWVNKTDKAVAVKNSKWVSIKWYLNNLYDSSLEPKAYTLPEETKAKYSAQLSKIVTSLTNKYINEPKKATEKIQSVITKLEAKVDSSRNSEKLNATLIFLIEELRKYTSGK